MSTWPEADEAAARGIAARHAELRRPIAVGLAGAQGSGKSTMAPRLADRLAKAGLRTATLALDDFYLTRDERQELARSVHPMLATRGVPGSHDICRLDEAIDALLRGEGAEIPHFDKGSDDRSGVAMLDGSHDVVLLEGWCVGARPQSERALADPVNALEREEDPDGRWRRWVNAQLSTTYAAVFARLDYRVFLRAPSFDVVHRWRGEQEEELRRRTGTRGMNSEELGRFIAHFERITLAMLADPPADLVIELDEARSPRL